MTNPTDTQIDTAVPVDGEPSRTLVNAALKSITGESEAHGTKLAGIQDGATANSTDLVLLDRANHTGTQAAATISDLPDLLAGKVDAEPGKVLSDTSFTQAEKDKLSQLEDSHFKGGHIGVAGLEAAHPTAVAGDFAFVDDGVNLVVYRWNALSDPAAWELSPGESAEVTPAQVKQLYEDNPDTNPLTDTLLALLESFVGRFGWKRQGTWNADTNTPELLNGTGNQGDYYVVTTPGTRSFGGLTYTFQEYDWVMFSGGVWQRMATNHITTWGDIQDKPAVIAAGSTQEAARTAIDALGTPDKGAPSGVAPLGAGGQVPVEHIPDLSATYAPKQRGNTGPAVPAVYVANGAVQSVASGDNIVVAWNSPIYDQFTIKNGNAFIVPSWATRARVSVSIIYDTNATGYRYAGIRINGTARYVDRRPALASTPTSVTPVSPIVPVSPGDSLDVITWQNSGGALDILHSSACWVQIELYGAA